MSVSTALCLSPNEARALIQGHSIATLLKSYIYPSQNFALCCSPSEADSEVLIRAWASCELCKPIDNSVDFGALVGLPEEAKELAMLSLKQGKLVFLTLLRVYLLSTPAEVAAKSQGQFLALLNPLKTSNSRPVVSDSLFAQRKHKLENLEPPDHSELEALHDTIAQLTPTNPAAIHLEQDLKYFLGWAEGAIVDRPNPNSVWIHEITQAGNSSDGDRFEKLVRKSFIELGFQNSLNNPKASLNPESSGGAAGLDIYCETPYPLVGECKASKHEKVPNTVSAQLIHLGHTHLGKAQFDCCTKILFVAGRLTDAAEKAAVENGMNVMRPETLERLVTVKSKYPGAINLLDLKACLEAAPFGEMSDDKVNSYLDRIQKDIEVRSRIVELLQSKAPQDLGIETIWGAYEFSNPPRSLNQEQLKDILIELSSPLTGFIGRKDRDRFYFLRPLNLES